MVFNGFLGLLERPWGVPAGRQAANGGVGNQPASWHWRGRGAAVARPALLEAECDGRADPRADPENRAGMYKTKGFIWFSTHET